MNEKVIVAVPTYNAGEQLLSLAEQLSKEQFDEVYILDDCSTDQSIDRLAELYPKFNIISGQKNEGPAANRNQIINTVKTGCILFIDADMTLKSTGISEKVQLALKDDSVGLVGGLILDKQKLQMNWNYGYEMNPRKDAWFSAIVETINRQDITDVYRNELVEKLHDLKMDYAWVYPATFPLVERKVDWVAEGLFAIRAEVFSQLGGFDENMRYHEGQDLAKKVRDMGLSVKFIPTIKAMHSELDIRGVRREADFYESQYYYFHKHWGMSR